MAHHDYQVSIGAGTAGHLSFQRTAMPTMRDDAHDIVNLAPEVTDLHTKNNTVGANLDDSSFDVVIYVIQENASPAV